MSNSTFLGYGANSSVDGVTNSTAIGNGAQVTASNQVVIGNGSVTQTLLNGNVGISGDVNVSGTFLVDGVPIVAGGGGGGNVPWTPTDQSGAGLIFTNVHVGSSRIGNMVFVYGSFSISITSDTNYVQIGGLPVTTPSNCFIPAGNAVCYYTSQTMAQVWPYSNSNNFTLYSTSGSVSQVTNNLLSGQTLYFSFSYPVSF